jgi:hypothetical protein
VEKARKMKREIKSFRSEEESEQNTEVLSIDRGKPT